VGWGRGRSGGKGREERWWDTGPPLFLFRKDKKRKGPDEPFQTFNTPPTLLPPLTSPLRGEREEEEGGGEKVKKEKRRGRRERVKRT